MTVVKRSARPRRILRCEHCAAILSREVGDTVKLSVRSRMIAFKSLDGSDDVVAEMPCPSCGRDTKLPLIRLLRHLGTSS